MNLSASLPTNLTPGVHHIEVTSTSADGSAMTHGEAFTVISGHRIGSIGFIPPKPLIGDVQFDSRNHRSLVLVFTAGVVTALAAAAAGLGSLAGAGSSSGGGPGGPGGSGGSGQAALEDVELERMEGEVKKDGRGESARKSHLPGTKLVDRLSRSFPSRAAAVSPVVGRVAVDGDYLRAILGSAWLLACLASVGLGVYSCASTGWYAVPPTLGLFVAILGLSIFDATLGLLSGVSFFVSALLAGHMTSTSEVRLGFGLVLVWFAVPLAAAALRPLRRAVSLKLDGIWERAADLVVCGLFAAWVTQKMMEALSGLAGVELPIERDVGTVVWAVMAFIGARMVVETFVAHILPHRLEAVHHEGSLESGKLQIAVSLVVQIAVFIFISIAIFGVNWALIIGTGVFFTPLVLGLIEERLPKSRRVTKWKPRGIVAWTIIIITGVLLGHLLSDLVHSTRLVEEIGFIVLPLPVLIFWTLELFEENDEREREDLEQGVVPEPGGAPLRGVRSSSNLAYQNAPDSEGGHPDVHVPVASDTLIQVLSSHSEPLSRLWAMRVAGVALVVASIYAVRMH